MTSTPVLIFDPYTGGLETAPPDPLGPARLQISTSAFETSVYLIEIHLLHNRV